MEGEKDCTEVLQQIAGARGAINGLMAEVIEDHMHAANPSDRRRTHERRRRADRRRSCLS
uniref:metal-sensing transcriptional repressor n=1 Tax=Candidatus Berkiella aquae TaxID=295108 RepID=UPI0035C90028